MLNVISGGVTTDTTILGGGRENSYAGGVSRHSVVSNGGKEEVLADGVASGTVVGSGGLMVLMNGGIDSGSVISSGGEEFIYDTASASNVTLLSGGVIVAGAAQVDTGGVSIDGTTIKGGRMFVYASVSAGQTIGFSGSGGLLDLENISGFSAAINHFGPGDMIDMGHKFKYAAKETLSFTEAASHTSGTLTFTDGSKSKQFDLLGSYTTSRFTLGSEASGQAIIGYTG